MYLNALEITFVQSDWPFYNTNEFSVCSYFLDYCLMGELNHHNLTLNNTVKLYLGTVYLIKFVTISIMEYNFV